MGAAGLSLVALICSFRAAGARAGDGTHPHGRHRQLGSGGHGWRSNCVRHGDLVGCGWLEGSVQTTVFPYPALQIHPGGADGVVPARRRPGAHRDELPGALLPSVSMLAIALVVFRRRPRSGLLVVAALVGSSLMYQATSSFGEALAAAMMVAAVVAAIERRPMLLFATGLLACLGKRHSARSCWCSCSCVLGPRTTDGSPVGHSPIAAVVGIPRDDAFGGVQRVPLRRVRNRLYLDPRLHTEGVVRKAEYFGALWVSPAAGIVWFWPVVIALGAGRRRLDHPQHASWHGHHSRLVPPAGGVGAHGRVRRRVDVLVLTVRVGSRSVRRLAVPILPAATIALLHTTGEGLIEWVVGGRLRAVLIAAVATVASIPQYGVPWRWFDAVLQLISPSGSCPPMTEFDIYGDPTTYYECTSNTMWRWHPHVLDDTLSLGWSVAGLAWVAAAAGCCLLLVTALWPVTQSDPVMALDPGAPRPYTRPVISRLRRFVARTRLAPARIDTLEARGATTSADRFLGEPRSTGRPRRPGPVHDDRSHDRRTTSSDGRR